MNRKLTQEGVRAELKNTEANEVARIVWDTLIPGFGFRIRPTAKGTVAGWVFKYRLKRDSSKAFWLSLKFPEFGADEARTWARDKSEARDMGRDPGAITTATMGRDVDGGGQVVPSLRDYSSRYLARKASGASHPKGTAAAPRTIKGNAGHLAGIARDFATIANKPLNLITQDDVLTIVRDPKAPIGGNRKYSLLSNVFNVAAADQGAGFDLREARGADGKAWRNPCKGIGKAKETGRQPRPDDQTMPRFFGVVNPYTVQVSDEAMKANRERLRFLKLNDPRRLQVGPIAPADFVIASLIKLQALTGARGAELRGARWGDISYASLPGARGKSLRVGVLLVEEPKERTRKEIPLSPEAVAVLASLPFQDQRDGFIFPGLDGNAAPVLHHAVNDWWKRHRVAAGLSHVRLHDLRHFYAGELIAAGASLAQIGQLFGHRNAQTTMRYAYLDLAKKQELVRIVSGRISSRGNKRAA